MKVRGIVVYAGSEKLVEMTENMLEQFKRCPGADQVELTLVNNGAQRQVRKGFSNWHAHFDGNQGFAKAVNFAIDSEKADKDITHFLVMNNDLEFPQVEWLKNLLHHASDRLVVTPTTDRTATPDARAEAPVDLPPKASRQVSAFCWLVSRKVVEGIRRRYRFPLFDPEFFAYGEDDFTAAILRKMVNAKPFLVVQNSWVRHLKAKTGKEMGLSGGMEKNLQLLRSKLKTHGLS